MKNKTAVTQLIEELNNFDFNNHQMEVNIVMSRNTYNIIVKAAKHIEKQQIIDAARHFGSDMSYVDAPSPAEMYYSQTFKND